MTIEHMPIACCINEATNTQYGILIAFLMQQLLQNRVSVLCYTCIACLVRSSLKIEHKLYAQSAAINLYHTVTISMTPLQPRFTTILAAMNVISPWIWEFDFQIFPAEISLFD